MKKTMILQKGKKDNAGNDMFYFLRTINGIKISSFCKKELEEYFPTFKKKKPGTSIKIDVELIPCTLEQAQEFEIVVMFNYNSYDDMELRKYVDNEYMAYSHIADVCPLSDSKKYMKLKKLFEGIKKSNQYGLIVHY